MTTRIVLVTSCLVAMATLVAPQHYNPCPNQTKEQSFDVTQSLQVGDGIGLILGMGGFALLVAFGFLFIRYSVYNDVHLLDTFFDAGGNNNFAVVATSVVSRWLWSAFYLPTFGLVYLFGIVGQYALAAITSVQLLLFSIIAFEFRTKAPGAKTFLQVIRCRFGSRPHVTMMFFAVAINLFIIGMVIAQGSKGLSLLIPDLSEKVIILLLSVAASIFSVVGGEGGSMFMGYFACAGVVASLLCYLFTAFYPADSATTHPWGFDDDRSVADVVCEIVQCGRTTDLEIAGNMDNSLLTFSSFIVFVGGVANLIMCFSCVFINQAFWTSATKSEPHCAVYGFLTAGASFFAIPFTLSFVFGMGYWVTTILQGLVPVTADQVHEGYVQEQPFALSQLTLGTSGDFLMSAMIIVVVMMAVSSQIHSVTAIFVYDIFQTYLSPFRLPDFSDTSSLVDYTDSEISKFLDYNRQSLYVRHAVTVFVAILTFPLAVVFNLIEIEFAYKFMFVGVVAGSTVLPVCLSVLWHRMTSWGCCAGVWGGLVAGLGCWLGLAATHPGGLGDFVANTGRLEVLVAGLVASFGCGGVFCVLISLCTGGLDEERNEEEEWEKCERLDNPVKPWSLQYAISAYSRHSIEYTGPPGYEEIRYQYRSSELAAYIIGTLLTVILILVWPAMMLLAGVFTCSTFNVWTMLVVVLLIITAFLIGVLPVITEIIQLARAPEQIRHDEEIEEMLKEAGDRGPHPTELLHVVPPEEPVEIKTIISPEYDRSFDIDENVLHVSSHALAVPVPVIQQPAVVPDDESSIVDNSDGLNVLADPRAPPTRKTAGANTTPRPKSVNTSEPILYPLSAAKSFQTCFSCGPPQEQYCLSATDIPRNVAGVSTTPTPKMTSTGGATSNWKTLVHLD